MTQKNKCSFLPGIYEKAGETYDTDINNYGLVLLESAILANEIEDTKKVIFEQPMLLEALKSPIVSLAEKEKIIDAVFPEGIRKFLKVVAVHHDFNKIQDIFAAYDKHRRKKKSRRSLQQSIMCKNPIQEKQNRYRKR